MVVESAQNVGVQKEKKCHSYNETSLVVCKVKSFGFKIEDIHRKSETKLCFAIST